MRRTAMALGPAGNEVLSVLNSAFIQTSSLGRRDYRTPQPSRKGSRSFVPSPCRWVSEVEGLADLGLRVDLVRGLADRLTESKREAAARLESAVHAFNLAAITPHWPQIEVYAAAGRTAAAALMAERGVEESLSNIHPAISWQAPVLTVTIGDECPPGCVHRKLQSALPREISWIADGRGLVLVPSVFFPAPTLRVPGPEEDEPVVITFPVVTDWHAFAATEGSEKRNPLADLMGSTRALVLETLADGPHSTSGFAAAASLGRFGQRARWSASSQ